MLGAGDPDHNIWYLEGYGPALGAKNLDFFLNILKDAARRRDIEP